MLELIVTELGLGRECSRSIPYINSGQKILLFKHTYENFSKDCYPPLVKKYRSFSWGAKVGRNISIAFHVWVNFYNKPPKKCNFLELFTSRRLSHRLVSVKKIKNKKKVTFAFWFSKLHYLPCFEFKSCLQFLLAISAGNSCWQFLLAIPAGNSCWQFLLAIRLSTC